MPKEISFSTKKNVFQWEGMKRSKQLARTTEMTNQTSMIEVEDNLKECFQTNVIQF